MDSMLEGEVLPRNVKKGVRSTDVVPCSEAWTVLKCHPNIAFASKSVHLSFANQSLTELPFRFTNARGRRGQEDDLRWLVNS